MSLSLQNSRSLRDSLRPVYHAALRKPLLTVLPPLLRHLPVSSKILGPPKGVISSTKDWVQQYTGPGHAAASYTKIDEGQAITRTPPKTLADCPSPLFNELTAQSGEAFVAVLPDGRVWHSDAAIITPDDWLLEDVSAEYDHERYIRGRHSVFSQARLPRVHHEAGTVAVLTTLSADYYSHWLLDVLPRMELLHLAGYPAATIDKFYLIESKYSYQVETLARLGIPESKIIDSKRFPHVQADRLVVPSLARGVFQPSQRVCRFLRQGFSSGSGEVPSRLYISRAGANHRRVLNEDKVMDFLRSLGFRSLAAESLSMTEKARLFSAAEAVVFPAGSGYANILFCQPGTPIVEIFNPVYLDMPTWALSNTLGLDYHYALGKPHHTAALPIAADILVDIEVLAATLTMAGIHGC